MKGEMVLTAAIFCAIFLHIQQVSGKEVIDCLAQLTCGDCMAAGPHCSWCKMTGDIGDARRCDLTANLLASGSYCKAEMVVSLDSVVSIQQGDDVRNAEKDLHAIQITPQQMKIKMRPHEAVTFPVLFRQAENFPVDIYFVMDLSNSMGKHKSKLAELGDLLSDSIAEITSDFQLGFGSFVDKKTMPYVSMVPNLLVKPCEGCVSPYGFHNQMPLTSNTSRFRSEVLAAPISGNLDSPEGGLDAVMQAIVCENIGWREKSRRMLIFSTDAGFHFAGDGKLGGVVTPNDATCHLDQHGYYSQSLELDYPSISQMSNTISDQRVSVIFAVTANQIDMYKQFSDFIESSTVGKLAADSSNVVTLIRDNYEEIASSVEMNVAGNLEGINVNYHTKCFGSELLRQGKCDGVAIGDNVTFEVTLEATGCPDNRDNWRRNITLFPLGLPDKLIIEVELICECDCERPENEDVASELCGGQGTYECGACSCNDNYYGKKCECDASRLENDDVQATCKMSNETDLVCEGRGRCLCGKCHCDPISTSDSARTYGGDFCECNDYSCDYYEDQLCAGPAHGLCVCGLCSCTPEYTGSDCLCPVSNETCINKRSGLLCNNKGTCDCGRCACFPDSNLGGPTCGQCLDCEETCDTNKACVQCNVHSSGPMSAENCIANCTHVTAVNELDYSIEGKDCHFKDDDKCLASFLYEYESGVVYALRTKDCPKETPLLPVILGIVGAILLIGLVALIVWKVCTTIVDNREYAKFDQDRQNAKWDSGENPLYKQATSTFKNPTYKGGIPEEEPLT